MADPLVPPYRDRPDAPFVYFDISAAHGVLNGAIEIELAARTLTPGADGSNVAAEWLTTARLRCSPTAAALLRDSLDMALKMLEQPEPPPPAASTKMN